MIAQQDALLELIDLISSRRMEVLRSKITRYPREKFVASDVGECDRQMVYSILNWKDRQLHDEYLQAMFDVGKEHEGRVIRDLMELGIELVAQQEYFEIKNQDNEVICRGKIDGKIVYNRVKYPIEIKTMNVNVYNGIRDLSDFQKKPLLRKYLRQTQLYLYGHGHEKGMFILTDLQGHYKFIPVYLDYGEVEFILKRLESNWKHKKTGTLPDRIEYKDSICGKCPFSLICLADVKREEMLMVDNDEFDQKLIRRSELENAVNEYEELDGYVKETAKTIGQDFLTPNFMVVIKKQTRTSYEVPEEIKKPYATKKEIIIPKFIPLETKRAEVEK